MWHSHYTILFVCKNTHSKWKMQVIKQHVYCEFIFMKIYGNNCLQIWISRGQPELTLDNKIIDYVIWIPSISFTTWNFHNECLLYIF